MIVTKDVFFDIQSKMDYISYDQSMGYHDFTNNNETVYFIDDIDNPTLCAWGTVARKFKFISILRISGESYKNSISHKDYEKFYSQIIEDSSSYTLIDIVNNNQYSTDYELGIRLAGFIRPMVFSASPLSILLDFNKENKRSRSWRRNVNAASKNDLSFVYIENPNDNDIDIFVEMYSELSDRKDLGSHINSHNIKNLLSDNKYFLFFVMKNDEYLAARIVYINNETSYDTYAANSDKSIEYRGTTYFMMESIFDFLKDRGVKEFDFGRIGVGLRSSNGVYRFKASSGGDVINYNSSWVYCKNKYMDMLYSTALYLRVNKY